MDQTELLAHHPFLSLSLCKCHVTELSMRSKVWGLRMAEKGSKAAKKGEQMSQEKIITTFQQLRMEQRAIVNKISELEGERNEHKWADSI